VPGVAAGRADVIAGGVTATGTSPTCGSGRPGTGWYFGDAALEILRQAREAAAGG